MYSVAILLGAAILIVAYAWITRKRSFLANLRGPKSPSLLLGNLGALRTQVEMGKLEFDWFRQYGAAFRIGGFWGTEQLMTADPKAIQHVMHTAGYHFQQSAEIKYLSRSIMGRSLAGASDSVHRRQRKIMNPAFNVQQLPSFLPVFQAISARLSQKWKENVGSDRGTINLAPWLENATLDALGEAAFDYQFGALDDETSKLFDSLRNLFVDSVMPGPSKLLFRALWQYLPDGVLKWVDYLPTAEHRRFRAFRMTSQKVAAELVQDKASVTLHQASANDALGIFVRANLSEDPRYKLDDEEVLAQMANLMIAGHKTTSLTLLWILYELARHPKHQERVRDEILSLRAASDSSGQFTVSDMESLEFTNAVIKETLRLYPIVPTLSRVSDRDDVVPLSVPVVAKDGRHITEIPVLRNQEVFISIAAYNRLPFVWGEDAEEWNPSRFLDTGKKKRTIVGVYENLMTFATGVRSCIGWRFAVLEMQAILVELVTHFEFSVPEGVQIEASLLGFMTPTVKGKIGEGPQMPLIISDVE